MNAATAVIAGGAAGVVYFGGLWWTIARAAARRRPAAWFWWSRGLRLPVVVGLFAAAVESGPPAIVGSLLGMWLVRAWFIHRVGRYRHAWS